MNELILIIIKREVKSKIRIKTRSKFIYSGLYYEETFDFLNVFQFIVFR